MSEDAPIPADPRDWGPMRPYSGRRKFDITDPILEPLWSGTRVIAHVDGSADPDDPVRMALIEDLGADLAEELPEVTAALGRSVLATDAIVDGVISHQVGLDGVGAAAVAEVHASATGLLMRNKAELDVAPPKGGTETDAAIEGFIAFDLLRLDGTSLLDVPLLERKRLLESVIDQSELVRSSVHTRPPIGTWISTWKSLGLRGGILKAANSRYRPGFDSIEWRLVESIARRG